MHGWDVAVFRWINGWPSPLDPVFLFFSEGNKWNWVRLILLAVTLFCLWRKPTRACTVIGLAAWPLANELTDILKNGFQVLRPCVELSGVLVRVNDGQPLTSFGTASAHSANMAAVAAAFTWAIGWRAWPWWIVAFMTGLSRIYVGVHYPSQVLFGWACGIAVASAITLGYREVLKRRTTAQPAGVSSGPDSPVSPEADPQP